VLKNTAQGLSLSAHGKGFIDTLHMIDSTAIGDSNLPLLSKNSLGYSLSDSDIVFVSGEIVDFTGPKILKNLLKFTFDTFYRDEQSIGVVAGYALKDRADLASNGVLTFVLEEDSHARAIVGHIFIDSRGFVHAYEMMSVHKQILK
jgi:mRNA degradation ribonuclease J1/J2